LDEERRAHFYPPDCDGILCAPFESCFFGVLDVPQVYDAIVIGLGAMGSSAACHLAQRGLSVLGLEQFDLGHALGSSHGQSRIIRQAYFEHPDYVPLLQRSYTLWNALAETTDDELINLCGLVLAGRDTDAIIAGTRNAATTHGLPLDEVSLADAAARYPTLRIAPEMTVLFDPLGGYLRVENCVMAHLNQARHCGAELREKSPVERWLASADGVQVTAGGEIFRARSLVVCAGAWTDTLLTDLGLPLSVHRMVTAWFPQAEQTHRREAGAPVFAMETAEGFYYGFPALDERGVKIAAHRPGAPLAGPESIDRTVKAEDVQPIQHFAEHYIAGLETEPWTANTCLYTMTPDADFVLDRHPEHANVFIAAGFSGHGFKFSSVVGAVLADYCATGGTEAPVEFLSLSRFVPGIC